MTCKPESQKQRLERIAVQCMAAYGANPSAEAMRMTLSEVAKQSIDQAKALIKQLDALPLDE